MNPKIHSKKDHSMLLQVVDLLLKSVIYSLMDLEYGFFFLQANLKLLGPSYLFLLISSSYMPWKMEFGLGFKSLARFGLRFESPNNRIFDNIDWFEGRAYD